MKSATKIIFINLLIMLAYWLLCNLPQRDPEKMSAFGLYMAVCIVIHFLALVAMANGVEDEDLAQSRVYLLASGMVLLIGFSACYGTLAWS